MSAKPALLYYYPNPATFVSKDLAILDERYEVKKQVFPHYKKGLLPWLFLRQAAHLMWGLWRARLVVVQFGGYHALLPALLGKLAGRPVLIITGGTDCFAMPQIGYGNFNKRFLGWATGQAYKWATALSPVHESLSRSEFTYLPGPPQGQGVYHFVPGLRTPSTVIYNGYDAARFVAPEDVERVAGSFLSVAGDLDNPVKFLRKGADLLVAAARALPQFTFTLVGVESVPNQPANLVCIRWIDNTKLPALYATNRFYLQLSVAEGFPNALCEGMLCGCVPIGSTVAAIPYIIGDTGYILQHRDEGLLLPLLVRAEAEYDPAKAIAARTRVADNFSFERRHTELLALCQRLER